MKLVLTNDDGFDAPGLAALHSAAEGLGRCIVIAPKSALSGCSHQVTTEKAIEVTKLSGTRYVVDGTPADCVRVAFFRVAPDAEVVLSGINAGGNLGTDVFHSGTVAAAREAVLHGKRAIAISHYRKRALLFDWEQASGWLRPLIIDLLARPSRGVFWNINLPHLESGSAIPEIVFCELDTAPLPVKFRNENGMLFYSGNYHERQRCPGKDIDVCFSGKIAVTELRLY